MACGWLRITSAYGARDLSGVSIRPVGTPQKLARSLLASWQTVVFVSFFILFFNFHMFIYIYILTIDIYSRAGAKRSKSTQLKEAIMRSRAPKSSPVTSAFSIPRKPPASRERDIKRKGNLINDKRNTPNFRLKEKYKAFRIFICFFIILYIVGMASRWRTMTELAGSHFPLTPRPVVAHRGRER